MRIRLLVRFVLVLLAMAAPALVRAQFQPPTSEELKMTADPAYPDAAAVYLYREEKTDDLIHFRSEHVRIKILKEAAKDLATVNLGYLRGIQTVAAVNGRTIHSDGTIIPLTVKPEDLMRLKEGQVEFHGVVFNMPSVEVGSIIEYSYQIRSDAYWDVDWEIQMPYPVRKAHYVFNAFPGFFGGASAFSSVGLVDNHGTPLTDLMWYPNLPNPKALKNDNAGHFSLDISDVPPLPKEEWMPPIESQRYQVKFYYSPGNSAAAYWTSEAGIWLKEVNRFAEPTADIKYAVTSIVAPGDSDIDKAKKLYAAVQALDNTNFSRAKGKEELKQEGLKPAKRAEDTWKQKSGSGDDMAMLYLALLRAAGLTAYPMKLVNREHALFNQNYLSWWQLNDVVIILSTGGNEIVLDPGEKMCPFQMVHWKHSGAGGIRLSDKGVVPWTTPMSAYNVNTLTRIADVTVGSGGEVTAKLQFSMAGQQALVWRQLALTIDDDTLNHRFDQWLSTQLPSGVQAHLTRFAKLDDPNSDLIAFASATGAPGSATPKRLLLPGTFFSNSSDTRFIEQPNRTQPVDMHYAQTIKDGVVYHMPTGYTVETLPQVTSLPWPNHAILQIKPSNAGSNVTLLRTFGRAFTVIPASDYGALRDFYQKVAAADQQQLVLAAPAK
jgi:hypothetical protein